MNAFEVLQRAYANGAKIQFSKAIRRVKASAAPKKDVRADPEYTSVEVLVDGYHVQPLVDGSEVPFFFLLSREDVAKALEPERVECLPECSKPSPSTAKAWTVEQLDLQRARADRMEMDMHKAEAKLAATVDRARQLASRATELEAFIDAFVSGFSAGARSGEWYIGEARTLLASLREESA